MRSLFLTHLLFSCLFCQTFVSGDITSDETWTSAGNPYYVNGDLSIKATLTIDAGGTTDALIQLNDAGSARWYIYNDASDSDDLDIESASGVCMTIAQGGNVGIGTTAPVTNLTVDGTLTLKERAEADTNTATYGQLWVNTASPNELYF